MQDYSQLPPSHSGPRIGRKLHHHQRVGLSKLLFMENDYRSLFDCLKRQDLSVGKCTSLDLTDFPHLWSGENGEEWVNTLTDEETNEDVRPSQGRGMIVADDMGTGKTLMILGLIEATCETTAEWFVIPLSEHEDEYTLPTGWSWSQIITDITSDETKPPPMKKPKLTTDATNTDPTRSRIVKSRATLIICPKSVVSVWEDVIEKHWDGSCIKGTRSKMVLSGDPRDRPLIYYNHLEERARVRLQDLIEPSIILTSYESVSIDFRDDGPLHKLMFNRVILDEGHRARNTGTNLFEALIELKTKHLHILSGTPVQNYLTDLYAYVRLLDVPGAIGDQSDFDEMLVQPALRDDPTLLRAFGDIFAIRRLKSEIMDVPLPPKDIKNFWLEFKMLLADMDGVEDTTLTPWASNDRGEDSQSDEDTARAAWLATIVGRQTKWFDKEIKPLTSKLSAKIKWLRYYAQKHPSDKVVIFFHWKHTYTQVEKVMKEAGFDVMRLVSTVSTSDRQSLVTRFNQSKQNKLCLLSSIKVGGEGLSMIGAHVCIFMDLMWNPSWHAQAMDRLHRQGQKEDVTIYQPMIKDTYEEAIWLRQPLKRGFTNLLFPNDPPGELPISELPADLLQWLEEHPDIQDQDDDIRD